MERDLVLLLAISESHSELFEENESKNGVRSETNPRRNQTLKGYYYCEGVHFIVTISYHNNHGSTIDGLVFSNDTIIVVVEQSADWFFDLPLDNFIHFTYLEEGARSRLRRVLHAVENRLQYYFYKK